MIFVQSLEGLNENQILTDRLGRAGESRSDEPVSPEEREDEDWRD